MNQNSKYLKELLNEAAWFRKSNPNTKEAILNWDDSFDNVIKQLVRLPKESNNRILLRITELYTGKNHVLITFEQMSTLSNEKFLQELVFSVDDDNLEGMGLILLKVGSKVKYLGLNRKQNLFEDEYDWQLVKAYLPDFGQNEVMVLPSKLQKELEKIVGLKCEISSYSDLGKIYSDPLESARQRSLFAVTINLNKDQGVSNRNEGLNLIALKEVEAILQNSKNGLLLTALAKLKSYGIL